jgi:hypothetical protein
VHALVRVLRTVVKRLEGVLADERGRATDVFPSLVKLVFLDDHAEKSRRAHAR